jgi:glycine/D-amino acid oxidase-like deaminating enzyme
MGGGSRDGLPIVGESSKVKGFHVVYAPLGFTMGPICADLFSEQFLRGQSRESLTPYTPDRFLGMQS